MNSLKCFLVRVQGWSGNAKVAIMVAAYPFFMFKLLAFAASVHAQAVAIPPPGKIYFGAWLDTADSAPGLGDGDRPTKFNQRMGFNASVFQYGQNIPIDTFPMPIEQIEATGTDAVVYLTVYPRPTPWNITDDMINQLAVQCGNYNKAGRKVLMRFAPEMNGNWNYWGQQPSQFIALWRRMFTALRREAKDTALVWAPSSGNGYPYGNPTPSAADLALMDTNKNGRVDGGDDPYSPYYPGDEFVDWIGVSVYHYGRQFPWVDNVEATPGKFFEILNTGGFYDVYAKQRNKPVMIAETGASFHTDRPVGVGELAVKQSFWRQYITNATFLQSHPEIKLICLFEFLKQEEETMRDFRVSNSTSIREAFLADFLPVKDFYLGTSTLTAKSDPVPKAPAKNSAQTLAAAWLVSSFILTAGLAVF